MTNSNDTFGNRTRDLPTCSAVPQPTALLRAPPMVTTAYYSAVITKRVAEIECCTFVHVLLFRFKAELLSNVMKTKDILMCISFMGDNTP